MLPNEPEVLLARLPFADAQTALLGGTVAPFGDDAAAIYTLGWYGTKVHDERGSFCMVNASGPLADLVGDRLRMTHGHHGVLAYCFGRTELEWDIAVTRRVYAALELLAIEQINVTLEVLS